MTLFWVLFGLWIIIMMICAGNPNHRVEVWTNYIFVIGIIIIAAFLIGRSLK